MDKEKLLKFLKADFGLFISQVENNISTYEYDIGDKLAVIDKYNMISGIVGKYFNNQYAYDCFLPNVDNRQPFQYDDIISQFVYDAVQEKIKRDGQPKNRWED